MSNPAPDPLKAPTHRAALLWSALAFALTFTAFTLLWARYINPFYFPYGDNFSVLVNSLPPFHPSPGAWFQHGFQSYFNVYPDMSLHATNFIRPVVNGTFFLGWFVYGAHWSRYLLTTYAIIGLLAATVSFLAAYTLRLGWRFSSLITLCVILAPSVDTGALFDPTFAFDLLGGLLVLLAIAALVSDALLPAWIFLALAVFTKETTLFAPILAAFVVFLRRTNHPLWNRTAASAAFILPLIAWFALRHYDFHGDQGAYVFLDGSSHGPIHVMLVRIALGLATWPLAATVYWSALPLQLRLLQKATLALNLLFWITLAIVLVSFFINVRRRRAALAEITTPLRAQGERYAIAVLTLFCAISLITPLALNLPRRFGGVFFPLFLLCLGAAARHAKSTLPRLASTGMIAAVGAAGAVLIVSDLQYQAPIVRSAWTMASDYVLRLSTSKEPVLFSIDDLSARYSSTEYVRQFAGYKGRLVRVNDVQWNYACTLPIQTTIDSQTPGSVTVTSLVPAPCGDHSFNSVFPPIDTKLASFTRDLPFAKLHYDLLHAPPSDDPARSANLLRVRLQGDLLGSSLLVSDPVNLRYRKIPLPTVTDSRQ